MFNLSDTARAQLEKHFAHQEKAPIRVYMAAG